MIFCQKFFQKFMYSKFLKTDNFHYFSSMQCQDFVSLLSLDKKTTAEIQTNTKLCTSIKNLLLSCNINEKIHKNYGILIYTLAVKSQHLSEHQRYFIAQYIKDGNIINIQQLESALSYFSKHKLTEFKIQEFEKYCGIGISLSSSQINQYVQQFIDENSEKCFAKWNHPSIISKLKKGLQNANFSDLFKCYQEKIAKCQTSKTADLKSDFINFEEKQEKCLIELEKFESRNLEVCLNSKEMILEHKKRMPWPIATRFPPEPNGFLHIGHAKAMNFNFSIAQKYKGITILRYDDSNPDKESQEFIQEIENDLRWMGHSPYKITYASDYFDKLLECAFTLIKSGHAFVCKLTKEEAKSLKDLKKPSPFRNNSVKTNLEEFEKMIKGEYSENKLVLRAKIDFSHENPSLRDPAIYRVKLTPHPKTKNKYCVYPLYDFVHPICDSLEDITHSLCTLEFENRRELYYWSLDVLGLYKPYVWEYSRLNITYNVLSKRKIAILIDKNIVSGWDDPRLFTIKGLQRRGVPNKAIKKFCELVSVTRRGNDLYIDLNLFEKCIRDELFDTCKKAFAVLKPVSLFITNLIKDEKIIEASNGFCHKLTLEKHIFIDHYDLMCDDDDFKISPGKVVRLKYGPCLLIKAVFKDWRNEEYKIQSVYAELLKSDENAQSENVKKIIHWLPFSNSYQIDVNCYDKLFEKPIPGESTGDFLDDVNFLSKVEYKKAVVHEDIVLDLKNGIGFQFERLGYFVKDSSKIDKYQDFGRIVLNRIVELKNQVKKTEK